ncbi:MAG: hypothetical protein PUF11_01005 [Parafannyhessea umbonata]|uniref:hypothetical protein n=1 Tax=Parafannyhessea umbonata TaxID=604330 RepID=UPI0026ED81FD|nr:hypothetical protein [Parafannyhessea umbonata]MDD6565357.1 hypothetical protein [Parafannyhessea umbonata]
MGALIDTGATMTPAELAEHGVDVPHAVSPTKIRVRIEFTATRAAVERVCRYVAAQGATDLRRRFVRLDGGEL